MVTDLTQSQISTETTHITSILSEWQVHFRRQNLHIQNRLRQVTYHWVAHLLTEHPTRIYHSTFGLTPLAEPTTHTNHITIPRISLEETIVIPSATECTECRSACKDIQQIEHNREELRALEKYILKSLDPNQGSTISDYLTSPAISRDSSEIGQSNVEQQQPIQEPFSQYIRGSRHAECAWTGPSGATGARSAPISPHSTPHEEQRVRAAENIERSSFTEWSPGNPFPTSTPGRTSNNGIITGSGWKLQGRTIYSQDVPYVLPNSSNQEQDPETIDPALLRISPIESI